MGNIYIVGLGPGDAGLITSQTWSYLKGPMPLILRTKIHPSVKAIEEAQIAYKSYDYLYEQLNDFESLYLSIVDDLINEAQKKDLVYAVPGSPLVAERTVRLLLEAEKKGQIEKGHIKIIPGMSFLEVLYTAVAIDPVEGLYVTDGCDLERLRDLPQGHIIITQLYNQRVASEVKLSLMNFFDDEAYVIVVHHLSLWDERIERVKLYEMDRLHYIDHLTSLVIPKGSKRNSSQLLLQEAFSAENLQYNKGSLMPLIDVVASLLGPKGCPWDKKQDHDSLRRYLIEETAEVLEAIDKKDMENLVEELGDLLFQIVFHAALAQKEGHFFIDDVVKGITEKMIRRHPHVFGSITLDTAQEVAVNWEAIKASEKPKKPKEVLAGIPDALTTLLRAQKIQEKAAKVGFNWEDVDGIWQKLSEEIKEFKEAIEENNLQHMEEEAGDMLFCLVNLFAWYHISAENALRQSNRKFVQRFTYVEQEVKKSGRSWHDFTLEELDFFWKKAKTYENN